MDSEDLFDRQESEEFNIDEHLGHDKQENVEQGDQKLDDNLIDQSKNNTDGLMEDTENIEDALNEESADPTDKQSVHEPKLIQLPLSKIRALMKLDPDLHLASSEAVFSVAKATELFIESLAKEAYSFTAQSKKKTVQKKDVDLAISSIDSLMFLEGSMNF
ncbi:DNA polymerase epsilon subunit 4 [Condylostylus longicornis]|uniref:DNA polymerase epsilon subunit 4 n=1 Tax=Condylostylus longicornis TaxID=2530218 RepID=UPI00244DC5E8|nr:DNA polymerase epsilon subunit 4 [Condylostylus longicornis]